MGKIQKMSYIVVTEHITYGKKQTNIDSLIFNKNLPENDDAHRLHMYILTIVAEQIYKHAQYKTRWSGQEKHEPAKIVWITLRKRSKMKLLMKKCALRVKTVLIPSPLSAYSKLPLYFIRSTESFQPLMKAYLLIQDMKHGAG